MTCRSGRPAAKLMVHASLRRTRVITLIVIASGYGSTSTITSADE